MNYNLDYLNSTIKAEIENKISESLFVEKELSCPVYNNAIVVPKTNNCSGYVVSSNHKIIQDSYIEESGNQKYNDADYEVKEDDRVVIFICNFISSCYGHAITDGLRKLWFLNTPKYAELKNKGVSLIGLTYNQQPIPKYYYTLLRMLGVDVKIELITEPTRFKKIYLPENSLIWENHYRYFTKEFSDTINIIKKYVISHTNPFHYDKVYFTRTQLQPSLREMGESSLVNIFEENGFKIIAPETLPLEDQIRIVIDSKCFAATEGSISHTSIFCQPGTEIIVLRKCNHFNTYQHVINEVANLVVTYIDAHHSSMAKKTRIWAGPFYLSVTKYVRKYFNLPSIPDLYFLNIKWWWYVFRSLPFVMHYISNRQIFRKIEKKIRWN